jgi:transcriptional regulator with XRE-family HTH domain
MKLNTEKIKKEMARNNWNITQLATLMNISRQRLSYILSKHYKSHFAKIVGKFAKVLKVDERDLWK